MIDFLIEHSPMIGLIFFFTVFLGIAFWAMQPKRKNTLQQLAQIPLKEDTHV